jgi:hypothetical protein
MYLSAVGAASWYLCGFAWFDTRYTCFCAHVHRINPIQGNPFFDLYIYSFPPLPFHTQYLFNTSPLALLQLDRSLTQYTYSLLRFSSFSRYPSIAHESANSEVSDTIAARHPEPHARPRKPCTIETTFLCPLKRCVIWLGDIHKQPARRRRPRCSLSSPQ